MRTLPFRILALGWVIFAATASAAPLGTGFTYQGQLLKNGSPYSGSADFQFRLYNASVAGSQVGSDLTQNGLTVNGGLFDTQLDFGSVFDGTALWLSVSVKTPGDPGFVELTPRKAITASPYAVRALNGPAGSSQWQNDPNGISYGNNVGVGIAAAGNYRMQISNGAANSNALYVNSNNATYPALYVRNFGANSTGIIDDTSTRHYLSGMLGLGISADYPLDVLNTLGKTARITSHGSSLAYPGEGVRAALFVHGLTGTGVLGRTSGGIYASSTDDRAISGWSNNHWGVSGDCTSAGTYGVLGTPNEGVLGVTPNTTRPAGRFLAPAGGVAIDASGLVKVKTLQILGGADLAEPFDVAGSGKDSPEPGSVVVIDPAKPGDLRVSEQAYDTRVAGVISGGNGLEPGVTLRAEGTEHADGAHPVALTGRVWCKVDASFGAVAPGDLLTTSPTPGHAMKASAAERRSGAVLGKAMTSLETGRGLVLVLVSLQ